MPTCWQDLVDEYQIPVLSVHSPCLLVTARVWSTDPLVKLARSVDMAERLGAETVVVHPPFLWQRAAAAIFAPSIAELQERTSVRIAVENMFPVKVRGAVVNSYRPHWNPVPAGHRWFTLDLSHTATSGTDALELAALMGTDSVTCTSLTVRARQRTSTWFRDVAASPVGKFWKCCRATVIMDQWWSRYPPRG